MKQTFPLDHKEIKHIIKRFYPESTIYYKRAIVRKHGTGKVELKIDRKGGRNTEVKTSAGSIISAATIIFITMAGFLMVGLLGLSFASGLCSIMTLIYISIIGFQGFRHFRGNTMAKEVLRTIERELPMYLENPMMDNYRTYPQGNIYPPPNQMAGGNVPYYAPPGSMAPPAPPPVRRRLARQKRPLSEESIGKITRTKQYLSESVSMLVPTHLEEDTTAEILLKFRNESDFTLERIFVDFSEMIDFFDVEERVKIRTLKPGMEFEKRVKIRPKFQKGSFPVNIKVVSRGVTMENKYIIKVGGTEIY